MTPVRLEPTAFRSWGKRSTTEPLRSLIIYFNKIFATKLLHWLFPLFWYASWPCFEKVEFWPFDPQGRGGVCGKNICDHVAAFLIPFNLICNMTMFWKSWILTFWQHPLRPPRGSGIGLGSKITFDRFLINCISVRMQNFRKKYWQLTELLRNLNIWPLTPPKGLGKFNQPSCLQNYVCVCVCVGGGGYNDAWPFREVWMKLMHPFKSYIDQKSKVWQRRSSQQSHDPYV